ncbi:MAG: type II secretion system minor pseudopilin [Planctomycetota bacterium]
MLKSPSRRIRPARRVLSRRGIALVIVLMCSVLFYILITEFTATSRIEERASRNVKFKGESHYVALGGVNLLKMYLRTDQELTFDSLDDDWAKWGRRSEVKSLPVVGTSFFVSAMAEAESGKLNLNELKSREGQNKALYDRTLRRLELLIAAAGYENDFDIAGEANLARAIADYIDKDTNSWDNSVETEGYPNQELISLTEILAVEGMKPEIFYGYTRDAATIDDADEAEQEPMYGTGTETVPGLMDLLTVYGEPNAAMGAGKFNPSFMSRYILIATILDYWEWRSATPESLKDSSFEEKVTEAKKYADQVIQFRDHYTTKKSSDWDDPSKTMDESTVEEPENNDHPWDWPKPMWGDSKGSGYRGAVLRYTGQFFMAKVTVTGSAATLGKGSIEYRVVFKRTIQSGGAGPGQGGEGERPEAEVQTLLWMENRMPEKKSIDELTKGTFLK